MPDIDLIKQQIEEAKSRVTPKARDMTVFEIAEQFGLSTGDLRIRQLGVNEHDGKYKNTQEKVSAVLHTADKIVRTMPTDADMPHEVSKRNSTLVSRQSQLDEEYRIGSEKLRGRELINFKMDLIRRGWKGS